MLFIDSHCHLHDSRIISNIPGIASRAGTANVRYMVSCATMEENFELTAKLSKQFPSIIPCFGIHPWFVDSISQRWKDRLEHYLLAYPSGIGETGIDFTDKTADRDVQVKVFEHHFMLARELERPINIHIRNAWDTFIHMLKKMGKLKVPGLIHSYSGSADMIPIFEKYGLYISFSGSVTNPKAKKVARALKGVSKERFVLETDTPDIYPYLSEPEENRLNEPKNLPAIARIASSRMGMGFEEFATHAHNNSLALFHPILEKKKGRE
ncbi:MAG: TatD family hydrolase [Proteobacteria bacterium]|nr:TatD family hydrolase [Pseudomonadota bacterium]MBU1584231.1 TatD family hydrolase [Pseudomonadota bacterium]MBU2455235.1 TatD family hydrolase [Pseudomonadota bacterium]MBU2629186.1 TatD family hydrolase [Pseudomonadota bacterium]